MKIGELFEGKIYTEQENKEMAIIGPTAGISQIEIGIGKTGRLFSYSSKSNQISLTNINLYGKIFTFKASLNNFEPYRTLWADLENGTYREGGSSLSLNNPVSLRLFSMGDGEYAYIGRLYYIRIYDNSEIVREFIPCYRISDNRPGLYDIVNELFYTNDSGSETDFTVGPTKKIVQEIVYNTSENILSYPFTLDSKYISSWNTSSNGTGKSYALKEQLKNNNTNGANIELYAQWSNKIEVTLDSNGGQSSLSKIRVNPDSTYDNLPTPTRSGYEFIGWSLLPDTYQEVNYIEGTGTQYIVTDIIPNDGTGVYARFISKDLNNDRLYFGSGNTQNSRFWIGTYSRMYLGWNKIMSRSSGDFSSSINPTTNTMSIVEMNYLNDRDFVYNGTTYYSGLPTLESKTHPMTIFGANQNSNNNEASLIASMQLYEFKISQGGAIVRNYIPCYRISDGAVGLYETITNTFYPNANTSGNDFTKSSQNNNISIVTSNTSVYKKTNHSLVALWEPN